MKKSLTLIELMVVIIIIGIIGLISIPNVRDIKEKSIISAALSDKRVVQEAIDKYYVDKAQLPSDTLVTTVNPSSIKWDELTDEYLRTIPVYKDRFHYWVDAFGSIWMSEAELTPSVTITDNGDGTSTVSWSSANNATGYRIGKLSNATFSWITNINTSYSVNVATPQSGETIMVSSIDKHGFYSAPIGIATNNNPIAVITMSPSINITTATNITWNSSVSSDPDGDAIVGEEWQNKQSNYSSAGTYTVRLRVQDSTGAWSNWAERTFSVQSITKPIAVITMTPDSSSNTITTSTPVSFDYTASYDTEGSPIVNVEWAGKQNLYTSAGNYTVSLRVQNSNGIWSDWVTKNFTVVDGVTNNKPTAVISMSPSTNIYTYTTITWDYSGSTDPDGDTIVNAEWLNKQSDYATAGTYTAQLRVQDSKGLWSDWTSKTFTVSAATKPIAAISYYPNTNLQTATLINWDYSGSTDPQGYPIVSTEWQGKQSYYDTAGTYTVQLRVQNSQGQWSDWTSTNITINATVITSMDTGFNHNVTLLSNGKVATFGYNFYGQLGSGNTQDMDAIREVEGLSNVAQVVAGGDFTIAVMSDGTLKGWGRNHLGQLGVANTTTQYSTPIVIPGVSNVKQVSAGAQHVVALHNDGTVTTWGYNTDGQAGLGNTTSPISPTKVTGLTGVSSIATGYYSSYAVMLDGTVKAWGLNSSSQLGMGKPASQQYTSPTTIPSLSNVKKIVSGGDWTLALLNDGTVKSFGQNNNGQMANGTSGATETNSPTAISGLSNVTDVIAGKMSAIAIFSDKTIKGWGANSNYQLGISNTGPLTTPTNIPVTNVEKVVMGDSHSFILNSSNQMLTTGNDLYGQLGVRDNISRQTFTIIH